MDYNTTSIGFASAILTHQALTEERKAAIKWLSSPMKHTDIPLATPPETECIVTPEKTSVISEGNGHVGKVPETNNSAEIIPEGDFFENKN